MRVTTRIKINAPIFIPKDSELKLLSRQKEFCMIEYQGLTIQLPSEALQFKH